ncbi:HNH endonuclease [Crocinitomicaceae bacterium]|nr:HNH endonuclease [Crocinitomicaceae bacterium]MDB3907046.1 HNH endonuclease [Crocinitomicaceae bacterium]
MAISDRTRKLLWAKSGNRCAICKTELLSKKDSEDFNIGEECHIISAKPNGPRHKAGFGEYDSVDNLILLCRNHHREIDELTDSYTEELLRYMKMNHENWVQKTIKDAIETEKEEAPRFLIRVTSGKELMNILNEVPHF